MAKKDVLFLATLTSIDEISSSSNPWRARMS